MSFKINSLFPTLLYQGQLPPAQARQLNRHLTVDIETLEGIDKPGRDWSRENYLGGYSSYNSEYRLHRTSPNFGDLERFLRPHVQRFIKGLNWDMTARKLEMTTCWANSMGRGTHHTMHIHPQSVISGVYYVNAPKGSSPLKVEDPRLGLFMASPPRKRTAPVTQQNYIRYAPKPGQFLLFESWLRHEVPPHQSDQPRLSVSFNFE